MLRASTPSPTLGTPRRRYSPKACRNSAGSKPQPRHERLTSTTSIHPSPATVLRSTVAAISSPSAARNHSEGSEFSFSVISTNRSKLSRGRPHASQKASSTLRRSPAQGRRSEPSALRANPAGAGLLAGSHNVSPSLGLEVQLAPDVRNVLDARAHGPAVNPLARGHEVRDRATKHGRAPPEKSFRNPSMAKSLTSRRETPLRNRPRPGKSREPAAPRRRPTRAPERALKPHPAPTAGPGRKKREGPPDPGALGCRSIGLTYRCAAGIFVSKVSPSRPSSGRSTTTVSSGSNSPPIMRLESGFSMNRLMALASGRPPNLGS